MNLIVGSLIVTFSVFGGFVMHGGQLMAIWQPYEVVIICGAAFGAFMIANPNKVIGKVFKGIPSLMKGPAYTKQHYLQLLSLMYEMFNKIRKEGLMGIEADIDAPQESALFTQYPLVLNDHHAVEFICDYMRLVVGGTMNPFELENLMDIELATHHEEAEEPSHAVSRVSDALPGFGIVAAVLGIVNTMGYLDADISVIGGKVAAALVGTFLGILLAYGFVGPMSNALERRAHDEAKFLACIKTCILANIQGYNPPIAVEFGRKTMNSDLRPSFQELEDHLRNSPKEAG